ncbi:MAG: penicillin-binding protein 1A [Gammaproteobacteria bacterium]|nr:penicillin-binding protein 1A [Gammaproteobacteria bacterium]
MKKSEWLLRFFSLATAALMIGLVVAGFLIVQANFALPDAQSIKSVELKVPLRVYSAEGLLISEFGNERRKPVPIEDIPGNLIKAVLASEDDNFYNHRGIDLTGLVRAAISNFRSGATQQGASTITMQVARNFFLTREKTYTRKLNEVLLAMKLEQILSKDEILTLYLNKIYLGHRAYGFGAAADVYYGRELKDLSMAETAMLAGLPKAPSSMNPLRNPARAVERRNYVLGRLRELQQIDEQEFSVAAAAPVTAQKYNIVTELSAPHIAEMVRAQLIEEFGEKAYWAGLNVYTTLQAKQQRTAEKALRAGLQAYDRRHGFRGRVGRIDSRDLEPDASSELSRAEHHAQLLSAFPNSLEQIPALVSATSDAKAIAQTRDFGEVQLNLKDVQWAKRYHTANSVGDRPESMSGLLSVGDVVYIQPLNANTSTDGDDNLASANEEKTGWRLSQIPRISGALISMQPDSGRILALVGGYDFFLNKYNRAIQSIRQPGSNIKPFIYSAALDKNYTPATLISGAPIVIRDPVHGTVWRPENYSGKFFGPTRIREALSKSLNLVSIRLLRSIGIPYTRDYLQRFGIDMSRFSQTLTMALGSGGATPLEMLSAYSVLANGGYRVNPFFIEYVTDRNGEVVYRAKRPEFCDLCYEQYLPGQAVLEEIAEDAAVSPPEDDDAPAEISGSGQPGEDTEAAEPETYEAPRVMSQQNNFLTVSMLKDVVRQGTARKALALNRPDLAGKTGTTNDYVDAWFSGFNSKLVTTVWTGFDEPETMGRGEAGSVTALPIWIDYMREALSDVPEDSEELPEYIEQGLVNRNTGERTDELDPDAVIEYFVIEDLLPVNRSDRLTEINIESLLNIRFADILKDDSGLPEATEDTSPETRIIENDEDTEGLF